MITGIRHRLAHAAGRRKAEYDMENAQRLRLDNYHPKTFAEPLRSWTFETTTLNT